jgi:superoxide reductase
MTKLNEIYKCGVCGNVVAMVAEGQGELVCCGEPMKLLPEKTQDEGLEKHVPVIEKTENGIRIRVGSVEHPMEDAHYIQWIEVISNGRTYRKFLKPGDKPESEFDVKPGNVQAREFCNVHGLWRST